MRRMVGSKERLKMQTKLLFVCMGNICRSPAAEIIMKHIVNKNGLSEKFVIDSCGIIDYHVGEQTDKRMREQAKKRGYFIDHLAKQFQPENDFDHYDYILVMDNENLSDINDLDRKKAHHDKVCKITDYASNGEFDCVPDPYYGDLNGFDLVIDVLEDSCEGLFNHLNNPSS